MWTARVFTLYPELFPGPFNYGLYKKALKKKIWSFEVCNIREGATDKHKTVDDTPFGGGSGMIIKPEVLANSLNKYVKQDEKIIYLSPRGKKFTQESIIVGLQYIIGNHSVPLTQNNYLCLKEGTKWSVRLV